MRHDNDMICERCKRTVPGLVSVMVCRRCRVEVIAPPIARFCYVHKPNPKRTAWWQFWRPAWVTVREPLA